MLTVSFSLLFSSMPYVVITPIRVSSDGSPQGDVRIRDFTLSGTSYNETERNNIRRVNSC